MSIRVLVVDDNADVRLLLRFAVELRPGMRIVGEAVDGLEAVRLAAACEPDIIVLDREMPVASGLQVLPELRAACPGAVIVLFTASADQAVRRAAAGAGADAVRTKGGQSIDALVAELEELLLGPADDDDSVRLRVGPVDAEAARVWVASTRRTLAALLAAPSEIPPSVPDDLLQVFDDILREWAAVADSGEATFYWSAAARVQTVEALVRAWAELDQLDDATMERLGCSWSPPEARPFFDALTSGVVVALRPHEELRNVTEVLPPDWAPSEVREEA